MMTDPIADMLARIRNAQAVHKDAITLPYSKIKHAIAKILFSEGKVLDVAKIEKTPQADLSIRLKYDDNNLPAIRNIKSVSKPGRRMYATKEKIPCVLGGFGFVIISTSQGVMTGREAKKRGIGGELICEID